MAKVVGAIASSHTPTIGFAFDNDKSGDPVWAPIFDAYRPIQQWLADKRPDVLLFIYNDHVTSFFFDHYSAFALGIGASWEVADEGGGARDLPPVPGHPELAAPHRHRPDGGRVRHVVLPAARARSRLLLAAVDDGVRTSPRGQRRWCRCRSACCSFPSPRRAAATSSAQALRLAIESFPGRPSRGHRRHRRAVAPGPRRARRLQQSGVGRRVHGSAASPIRNGWWR